MLNSIKGEKGATAILVTASLLLLMGMAAVAIDYGAGLNERRQDQTGADLAVLGGALDLSRGKTTQAAVSEITRLVNQNVRATANAAWVACTDTGKLPVTAADLGLTPATQCISFDTFARIRVKVPNQQTSTVFARLFGAANLTTSAAAESFGQQFPGGGSPPPFAVLGSFSGGDVVCLRTSSSGEPGAVKKGNGPGVPADYGSLPADADPCDNGVYPADSSNFGLLDPTAYFDSAGNIACKNNANDYFIAAGIDHPLSHFDLTYVNPYVPGIPVLQDAEGCNSAPEPGGNTIPVKTGLTAGELRCGMLSSKSGSCGITVPGPSSSGLSTEPRFGKPGPHFQTTHQFLGENMDNATLWSFLRRDPSDSTKYYDWFPGWGSSCSDLVKVLNGDNVGVYTPADFDYYDQRDLMVQCLNDWKSNSSTQPLFTANVWDSARFAFVPWLYEETFDSGAAIPERPTNCPSSGGKCVHIQDFIPLWMQTLYTTGNAASVSLCEDISGSGGSSWGRHHAGQQNSCGDSNKNLDRVSAILLDCGMLPKDVCDARPGPPGTTPGGTVKPIVLLTK